MPVLTVRNDIEDEPSPLTPVRSNKGSGTTSTPWQCPRCNEHYQSWVRDCTPCSRKVTTVFATLEALNRTGQGGLRAVAPRGSQVQ
jgi:hypothetical protein